MEEILNYTKMVTGKNRVAQWQNKTLEAGLGTGKEVMSQWLLGSGNERPS